MTTILKSIHTFETKLDQYVKHFAFLHPYFDFFVMLIGMPVFILIAIAACTILAVFPIAWIFQWL